MNSVTKKFNLHCEEVLVLSFLRGLGTRVLPASSSTVLIASFLQGSVLCTRRMLQQNTTTVFTGHTLGFKAM